MTDFGFAQLGSNQENDLILNYSLLVSLYKLNLQGHAELNP